MLTPKKKVSKKEIKQDQLLTAYAKLVSFYYDNKKYITYAGTALAVVVIVIFVYLNNQRSNNERAATELGKIISIYDAAQTNPAQYRVAIEGQPERGVMGLKGIVENYGGTESGEMARFYLANAYFALKQYEEALREFEGFGGTDDLLRASAYAGVGACYEVQREYEKAAKAFERAVNLAANPVTVPEFLNSAARNYALSGEKVRAVELYKRLKKDYPTSAQGREADRFIAEYSL